jgi:glucose dehydrogenase
MRRGITLALSACLASVAAWSVDAQVASDRLLKAASEPHNWLTYSGGYFSQRYSELRQITVENVKSLEQKWLYQAPVAGPWQATPLVVDGTMYLTQRPNDVVAIDAKTGRAFWVYRHNTAPDQKACCGANNRGVAIHGDRLFMGTLDAYLVALNAKPAA